MIVLVCHLENDSYLWNQTRWKVESFPLVLSDVKLKNENTFESVSENGVRGNGSFTDIT